MSRYKAIFIDAGQTLIRPSISMVDMCVAVASEHGVAVTASDVELGLPAANDYMVKAQKLDRHIWASEETIRGFWRGYYSIVFRRLGLDGSAEVCSETVYDRFNLATNWEIFPDVIRTVPELKRRGYTLGVISDWGDRLVQQILVPLGLSRYFDFMVASATVRAAKPHPDIFRMALARAGAAPDECMHVGDSYVGDVLGARGVGITPVLLDRYGLVEQADCLKIGSLDEILEHL